MKVSREQAATSRERILDAASRLFRTHGFDGIGVADLMKDAGLTHGAFYGHFSSKEDLMAQACARALANSLARWEELSAKAGSNGLSAIAKSYLSTRHRDSPGTGCALPSLGSDASRQGPVVRHAITEGLRSLVEVLARIVPGRTRETKRRKALAACACMVGALMLARAVDDPEMSEEILEAVRASLEMPAA